MKRVLDDMSHMVKLLARPSVRKPTPLREIVEEVIQKHNYAIEEGGVTFDVPAELPVVPIIESAAGVLGCSGIAEMTDVACLALGRFDLAADLGIDPDGTSAALAVARASVVLASAAARLDPALDSPWLKITDLDGLRTAAERARADGFGGMLVIHPSHVTTVNEVFSPTASELAWARGILASSATAEAGGRGAYTRDGEMVDEAIVKHARAILRDAQP